MIFRNIEKVLEKGGNKNLMTQSAWRDKRADVLRENLKKRKQLQKARKSQADETNNTEDEA